ncbi:MAG TPA: hypothetical protein VF575_03490 [Candidatus Saccharimonadales bacterium]|jgi:hypothetical protein
MPTKKTKPDNKPDNLSSQPVRIFDVARPGTLQPAGSSARPVIVTNRTIMQDPMVVQKPAVNAPVAEAEPQALAAPKLVITPLEEISAAPAAEAMGLNGRDGQDIDADGVVDHTVGRDHAVPQKIDTVALATAAFSGTTPAETSHVGKSTDTAAAVSVADTPSAKKPASAGSRPTTDLPASADTKSTPDVAPSPDSQSDQLPMDADPSPVAAIDRDAAKLEADARAQDEIDTLVEQKSYFLPINAVEKRRSKHVFIFGLILIILLALLWIDLALDAGFIMIDGIRPITHFFSN